MGFIGEADDRISQLLKFCSTIFVVQLLFVLSMVSSVNLNHQILLQTDEVRNVISNGMLTSEMEALQGTKVLPHHLFRQCHLSAVLLCKILEERVSVWIGCLDSVPHII